VSFGSRDYMDPISGPTNLAWRLGAWGGKVRVRAAANPEYVGGLVRCSFRTHKRN
jgi:hypothetical protein